MQESEKAIFSFLANAKAGKDYDRIGIQFTGDELTFRVYKSDRRLFKVKTDVLTGVFELEVRGKTEEECIQKTKKFLADLERTEWAIRVVSTKPTEMQDRIIGRS